MKDDKVEVKLIATKTNLAKFAAINLSCTTPSEKLLERLICSCIWFLLNIKVIEVWLDEIKVK